MRCLMKQTKLNRKLIMENLYQFDFNQSMEVSYEPTFEGDYESLIYDGIIANLNAIDKTIEEHLFNYSLKRLSFVDRAILRIAVYEIMFSELPVNIVINEAIMLTKKFSDLDDEKQHKFNNRVLDNIAKKIRG